MRWNGWVLALEYPLKEAVHVFSTEWWDKRTHFVDHAAKGPYVRFQVIGLVLPYLGRGVVRRASLGV